MAPKRINQGANHNKNQFKGDALPDIRWQDRRILKEGRI